MGEIFRLRNETEKLENLNFLKDTINNIKLDDEYFIVIKKGRNKILSTSIFDTTKTRLTQSIFLHSLSLDLEEYVIEEIKSLKNK